MARRQSGFTRASALGPIAEVVGDRGGSIARIFQDVDLPPSLLETPETLVPLREQFRLLARAARATGDAEFGAELGSRVRVENLSAFGTWVLEAETLAGAIGRSALGLNKMLQTSTDLALTRVGPLVRWSIEFLDPECEGRYHNELLGLGYMIDAVRCFAGPAWIPDLVLVASPRSTPKGGLEQILGTNVSTGHAVPAILFDAGLLRCARHVSPQGARPLSESPPEEPPVPAEQDELASIAAVISLALCQGYPRVDWVAAKLGLTRRTLQRLLHDHGTTFARLVEALLRKHAEDLLARSTEPITAIALRLGYNDTAHFTRAFRRWTGATPSTYRSQRG